METKAEVLLKRMDRLYRNIYNLLGAFHKASSSNSYNPINVELIDENNVIKQLPVNSFLQLQQEINRIDENFKSLITKPSYVLSSDGTLSQYSKTTFATAEYLENFHFDGSKCFIDKNSMIEDFVYPTIKLPVLIDKDFLRTDIYAKIYEVTYGWENITDNPKEIHLIKLNQDGKLNFKDYSRSLKLRKQEVKYFGTFTVQSVTSENKNTYNVVLDKLYYTEKERIGDVVPLQVGDILITDSGLSKFKITDFSNSNNIVTLVRVGGTEELKTGINKLVFNEILESQQNIIDIPVKPNQKIVVFLSTENQNTISYPSVGIKIDTEEFTVDHDGITYTIDEYFQKYVTNFSQYLNTLINDSSVPYSLGIRPNKPVLNIANFRVVQINKHTFDKATENTINELNKKKQLLQNEIDAKQILIDQAQGELDSQKFNSVEEKTYRLNRMQTLRTEINTLKANLLTISRDIDSNAAKYNIKNKKPKYKVIGFWDIQEAMYSPVTPPQHIIKYEVQYRYLQKNVDISEATTYKMISNGEEIIVAFSNWVELNTHCLTKVENLDGKLVWETNSLDSVNDININQCSISINEGESIEIKVRAVSEAGYPISPMKSEWSEPIRIDFPDSLKTSSLQATVIQNDTDLRKAEFDSILQNYGILNHVSDRITEAEKIFYHSAKNIASGQYTAEQKNIPLDECIKNILNDIAILKAPSVTDNIIISFVDFNNETYIIRNNTTLEVFAGNYTDTVDVTSVKNYGDIVRKVGYLRIKNNNNIPVELNSLVPGNIFNNKQYYDVPVCFGNKSDNLYSTKQVSKQIIYLRNIDLIGSKSGGLTEDSEKLFKLIEEPINAEEVKFSTDNGKTIEPKYIETITKYNKFNNILRKPIVQKSNGGDDIVPVDVIHFIDEYDKYAVGANTVGAFLYPVINDINRITVDGNSTTSSLIISADDEILIPIVFEYRMIDINNNMYDESGNNIAESNKDDLTYIKKIGFDLMLNNSVFKFDLQVSAKYQSKFNSIDMLSVKSNFNNESKENLI